MHLGINPQQRDELRAYFSEKAPKTQNEQVAVLGVKVKEYVNKEVFNIDEMHSAFKIVNKPTPKNLSSVFGNMKRDGKADYQDNTIIINSFTEDFVNFHMQRADD